MEKFVYTGHPKRLSKVLCDNLPEYSYSYLQKILRKGDVKINGKRTKEDVIVSDVEIEVYCKQNPFSPEIVYENEIVVIFNKFYGISSESYAGKINAIYPNYILVHRLDTNTSGLIIFAKNNEVFEAFKEAFFTHSVEKHYYAEVFGITPSSAEYSDFIIKYEKQGVVKILSQPTPESKSVITRIKTLETDGEISKLDVQPITGRTHQIRAHLAYHGFPIVGDGKYGIEKRNSEFKTHIQHLSAVKIIFHTSDFTLLKSLDGITVSIPNPVY